MLKQGTSPEHLIGCCHLCFLSRGGSQALSMLAMTVEVLLGLIAGAPLQPVMWRVAPESAPSLQRPFTLLGSLIGTESLPQGGGPT